MVNTGLRPDEALRLQFRDVEIEEDDATGKTILVIKVRGKRGVGYCKSMPGAVEPFRRLQKRPRPVVLPGMKADDAKAERMRSQMSRTALPEPTDLIFPRTHRDLFNEILGELDLKTDREGNERTSYSASATPTSACA